MEKLQMRDKVKEKMKRGEYIEVKSDKTGSEGEKS